MRLIRAADLVPVPWKNGGGVTREVAVEPPGAGFDDFDWRLSMADIARDGPFSAFPGVDRVLVLMQGDGLVLEFDDQSRHLRPGGRADFPAERAANGRLTGAAVRDLNIMTRRDRMRAEVRLLTLSGTLTLLLPWPQAALVVREGALTADGIALARQDSLLWGPGEASSAVLAGEGDLVVVGLSPATA